MLYHRAGAEDEVAAVLGLVDRGRVVEAAARLVLEVEAEAEAGRVDPRVDDLAEAPCSPGKGQGVCDLSQALRIRNLDEVVPLLGEGYPGDLSLASHVLMLVCGAAPGTHGPAEPKEKAPRPCLAARV
jgi:hypothetical protein